LRTKSGSLASLRVWLLMVTQVLQEARKKQEG
jgi:hypothetical protein